MCVCVCVQVVVLGSAPNPEVHQMFVDMQTEMAETDNGRIILKYDEGTCDTHTHTATHTHTLTHLALRCPK